MKAAISVLSTLGLLVGFSIVMIGAKPTVAESQCGERLMWNDTGWCNSPCCTNCHCCKTDACLEP